MTWSRHSNPPELSVTPDEFWRLPRHPAYKTELMEGRVWWTYRPWFAFARLALATARVDERTLPDGCVVTSPGDADWDHLPAALAGAFHRTAPFDTMSEEAALLAATEAVADYRAGKDGEPLADASRVVRDAGQITAALLVCRRKPTAHDWPDDTSRPASCAHVEWIFVPPFSQRQGLASTLLAHAVDALRTAGEAWLTSGFYAGNGQSTLFHWRSGFELLPDPLSRRGFDAVRRVNNWK